jgi:hypothetical protein
MLADTPTYTAAELVTIISVILGGLVTIITAVFAGWAAVKTTKTHTAIREVANDVKTMNALSMGQLADAAETRRIMSVPLAERTTGELEHLAAVPPTPTGETPITT